MEADHALVHILGKGGGTVDLIQRTFTQIKNITDHDHVQNPKAVTTFDITPQCIWSQGRDVFNY